MQTNNNVRLLTEKIIQAAKTRSIPPNNYLRIHDGETSTNSNTTNFHDDFANNPPTADQVLELFANLFGLSPSNANTQPVISPRYSINTVHSSAASTPLDSNSNMSVMSPPGSTSHSTTKSEMRNLARKLRGASVGSIDETVRMDEVEAEIESEDEDVVIPYDVPSNIHHDVDENWGCVDAGIVDIAINGSGVIEHSVQRDSSIESIDITTAKIIDTNASKVRSPEYDHVHDVDNMQVMIPRNNDVVPAAKTGNTPSLTPRGGAAKLAEALHNLHKVNFDSDNIV